jgi:ABC-type nitrate/sulfonate/bicarbonate transport system substrate-binding protein
MSQSKLDTLWYTRCPVPTGLGIALQKSWLEDSFRSQNTVVKSLRESNDKSVRESHFDHTLQNSVRHGGNIPAIWARSAGRDTRVLGLSWADETQLILTTADSDIRTPKDLKGRRFGLPKWQSVQIDFARAQAVRGLENALRLNGLEVSDVELVDYTISSGQSDAPAERIAGTQIFSGRANGGNSREVVGLLRGEWTRSSSRARQHRTSPTCLVCGRSSIREPTPIRWSERTTVRRARSPSTVT